MSKSYADQTLKVEFFNWKCLICNELAHSPIDLEMQHLVHYGPYKDSNGDKWIKCDKCFNPYHVHCLNEYICCLVVAAYVCERSVHVGVAQLFKEFLVLFSNESINSSPCKLTTDLFNNLLSCHKQS